MAGTGRKWLVGCGVGCGAAVLLGILISVGGSLYMMRPFNKAVDTQKSLEAEYGGREAYVPPAEGITSDRLDVFIRVRRELMPICEEFQKIGEKFAAMDELDKGGKEPSKGEVLKAVGGLTGNIFGMVGNIGRFTELRNRALLDQGMSLGEYIWIYVLVYNSWQGHTPNRDFEDDSGQGMSRGEQKVMRALVRNHAAALADAGRTEEAALWSDEAEMMKRTETGVPFRDRSLPAGQEDVFEYRAAELENLYCAAMSNLEMNRIRKKGLSIHSE